MIHSNYIKIIYLIRCAIITIAFFLGGWININWIQNHYLTSIYQTKIVGLCHDITKNNIYQTILILKNSDIAIIHNINWIQKKLKCIPGIKKIYIYKTWLGQLKIYVVEYMPIAKWNYHYFLDDEGIIFQNTVIKSKKCNIPSFYGPKGQEKTILTTYNIMNQLLIKANLRIKTISMNYRNSCKLILQNGIQLELGQYNNIERLNRFIQIYSILLNQSHKNNQYINYVDLRYNEGLAVGWFTKTAIPQKQICN